MTIAYQASSRRATIPPGFCQIKIPQLTSEKYDNMNVQGLSIRIYQHHSHNYKKILLHVHSATAKKKHILNQGG